MRHRRKSRWALGALFLAGLTTVPIPVAATGRDDPAPRWPHVRPAGELAASETTTGTDLTGDAGDCRGDITQFGAGYEPGSAGSTAVVAVETACANDPSGDPAWHTGYSYAAWAIDTNLDGQGEYLAVVENYQGALHADIYDRNLAYVCSGSPSVQSGGRFLAGGFSGACLGSPPSFRVVAVVGYDTTPNGVDSSCPGCTEDAAPNSGWGPVTRLGDPAPPQPAPPAPAKRQGYWMVDRAGKVYSFGEAGHFGDVQGLTAGMEAVDLEPAPSGNGYWIVTNTGHVYAFRDAGNVGALNGSLGVGERVTSLSATPSGRGYWLFTSKGRVVPFGDAQFLGDMRNTALNGPVLDSIPTPTGQGYYMVGSDGGIFTFGDAQFFGSTGAMKLNAPVQSLVPDPDGAGYWLVASDGGIFAFEGVFYGSMGDRRLNGPVTGMVGFGNGYLMVGEDGGIFTFGEAPFFGSLGDNPPSQPIVSVAILNQ